MEKFHMCLLKKDMEVIKSAQLSYASYSVPIALSHAALMEWRPTVHSSKRRSARAGGRCAWNLPCCACGAPSEYSR